MKDFKKIDLSDIDLQSYFNDGEENFVIVSGGKKHNNVMNTSNVAFGYMQGKPIATIYLKKNYYTRGYVEKKGKFTINLFPKTEEAQEKLHKLSKLTGKDVDKFEKCGLTLNIDKMPKLEDAEYVLTCRVIYRNSLSKSDFFDKYKKWAKKEYEDGFDYAYVAEIKKVYEVVENDIEEIKED